MKDKQILILLLICIFTFNPILYPRVSSAQNPLEQPNILIGNDRWMPEFQAGEETSLDIPLENTSSTPARNAKISLVVDDLNKFPFNTDKMSFVTHVYSISRGSSVASFKVSIPPNVKPGLYPITVNVDYLTAGSASNHVSSTIYVKIVNPLKQPVLKCTEIKYEGEKLPAGQITPVNFKLINDGDLPLKEIELLLSGFTENGLTLDKGSNAQFIPKMAANETRLASFNIYVDQSTKSGSYTLDLAMKYKDAYDQEYTKESKVFIPVAGKDSLEGITPRIIIEAYDYGGGHVLAGEVFPLTLTFYNTSQESVVRNIKVSLNSDTQVFSPVGNSNTIYLSDLDAQGRINKTIMLKPKEKAESQTYNLSAEIDFQDSKGNKYTEKELISIPVNQTVRLFVPEISIPAEVGLQKPVTLPIDYYNAGRAIIHNLVIHTEGNFEIRDGEQFIGNLDVGKNDYCDITVIPQEEGALAGKVIFEYEDDIGTPYRVVKSINLHVVNLEDAPPFDLLDQMPEQEGFDWKKGIIPGIITLLMLTAGLFVYRKRKLAKKEVDFGNE